MFSPSSPSVPLPKKINRIKKLRVITSKTGLIYYEMALNRV